MNCSSTAAGSSGGMAMVFCVLWSLQMRKKIPMRFFHSRNNRSDWCFDEYSVFFDEVIVESEGEQQTE
jgi:hypothetical protein